MGQIVVHLTEDPGASLGGAADHHRVGARLRQDVPGLLGGIDVAVGHDRNAHGGLHLGNGGVVDRAVVAAGAAAAMHGDHHGTGRFGGARQRHRIAVIGVDAGTHLDGDRHRHGLDHALDDLDGQRFVAHQG